MRACACDHHSLGCASSLRSPRHYIPANLYYRRPCGSQHEPEKTKTRTRKKKYTKRSLRFKKPRCGPCNSCARVLMLRGARASLPYMCVYIFLSFSPSFPPSLSLLYIPRRRRVASGSARGPVTCHGRFSPFIIKRAAPNACFQRTSYKVAKRRAHQGNSRARSSRRRPRNRARCCCALILSFELSLSL